MKKLKLQAEALEVESFTTDVDSDTAQPLEFFATRPQVCDPPTVPPRCA